MYDRDRLQERRKMITSHVTWIYFFLSLLIAILGRNRKLGFWGYFFGSMFLTPFVGLVLLLASDKRSAATRSKP